MLIRFRVRNFRSLKEEQELSLVASSLKDSPEAVTQVKGLDLGLVRVAAIYGANASGKSNVIKALAYMSSAVQNSQRQWAPEGPIPREPFLLDPQSKLDPSSFEVDLLLDGVRFHYGFTLNDKEILDEWLNAYPLSKRPIKRQMWFKRKGKAFTFGNKLVGDNRAIERLTRQNSLFVSAAAQNGHKALLPLYMWFAETFRFVPRERGAFADETIQMCKDKDVKSWVLRALRAADLGVVGLDIREKDLILQPPPRMSDKDKALLKEVDESFKEFYSTVKKFISLSDYPTRKQFISLTHEGSSRSRVSFDQESESEGTVAFFGLLGPALSAIKSGGVVSVDELDASLHPLLALEVVRLFNDAKLNPRRGQIIFTTHDTNILDRASLRRDQIWFTEKDAEGGTHLYPLTDFKPRKNENLERGYLQGRYGAVPFIGSSDFLANSNLDKAER